LLLAIMPGMARLAFSEPAQPSPLSPSSTSKIIEEDGLKPTQRAKIIRKNSFLVLILIFLVLSLADIFYYAYQRKQFDVEKAVLNLDSSSSDAQLILDAELPLTSYLHSYAVRDGHCRLFYTESIQSSPKLVGEIFASVKKPSLTSEPGQVTPVLVIFDLQNTDFSQFRHLLWDFYFGGSDGAKFNIDCSASITITLYRLIPLDLKQLSFAIPHFSEEVELTHNENTDPQSESNPQPGDGELPDTPVPVPEDPNDSKSSSLSDIHRSVAAIMQSVSDLSSNAKVEVISTSTSRLDIGLNQQLPVMENPPSSVNIKSFSVQIPRVAYSLETVDENFPSTLLISNSPTEVEFFDTAQPELKTIVSLDCISLAADEDPNCSLLNGLNLEEVVDGLGSGQLSLRADSTPDYAGGQRSNFLTNFFGPLHSLTMEPITPSEARRLKSTTSTMSSSDLVSPRDPDLTDDSGCYLVTADSASESLICSTVDKGFSMMYLTVLDASGALATINSVTSWAPLNEFAFATDFEAIFRGGYSLTANVSASADFKNASLLFNYFENADCFLHGNAFTSWSFPNLGSQGNLFYSLNFFEEFGNWGALATEGMLTYGDNNYQVKLAQDVALNQLKYNLTAEGVGRYGGSWTQWFASLDSSHLIIDGMIKSTVRGLLSSSVSSTGTHGDLVLNVNALSGGGGNQLTTSNHANWDSMSIWNKEGTLNLNSSLMFLDGTDVNWNSLSALSYQDNGYIFSVTNFNLNALENFNCHGNGGYGGNLLRWFVSFFFSLPHLNCRWLTVDQSELWLNQNYQGDLVASLSSDLPNGGSDGDIHWYTLVRDEVSTDVMDFNTSLGWSTEGGWGSDGKTVINSKFLISDYDWDVHQSAEYGANRFSFELWNHNRRGNELGFVSGFGRYGGKDWSHWYACDDFCFFSLSVLSFQVCRLGAIHFANILYCGWSCGRLFDFQCPGCAWPDRRLCGGEERRRH
jgi:hypothetical protein